MKRGKKKLILCITKSNWGGAQRYVYDLATAFAGKYDTTVLLGGEGDLKVRLEDKGLRTVSFGSMNRDVSFFDAMIFFRLISFFWQEKPDIVHLNSSKMGVLGALAARAAFVPKIIFTAHGWAFREERPIHQIYAIKFLSWITIFLSHKIIAVSKYDQTEVQSWPLVGNKIEVIYNAIPPRRTLARNTAWKKIIEENILPKELFEKDQNYLFLVSIGELHKNKGYESAKEAIALLKNRRLNVIYIIFGDGEEKKYLQQMRENLDLTNNVFFAGERANASELLSAFDIFLLPSTKEGFPYVTLEAGMAEIPVIASAVGGVPEMIDDMKNGVLVRPKESRELAQAIEFFLENPKLAQRFSTDLKKTIQIKFSFEDMKQKTAAVYTQ